MVKTPKTRHSRPQRDPVTIELEPGAVSRIEEAAETAESHADAPEGAATTESAGDSPEAAAAAESAAADSAADAPSRPELSGYGFDGDDSTKRGAEAAEPAAGASAADSSSASGPAVPPRRGRASLVAAGFAGGVLALAFGGLLQSVGVLPGLGGAAVSLDGVNADIGRLREEVSALKDSIPPAQADTGPKIQELATSLGQVRSDLAALRQKVDAGGSADDEAVAAVGKRLEAVEAAVGRLSGGPASSDLATLAERIAAAEALAKSATDSREAAEVRLAAAEQALAALTGRVDAQAAQPKIALAIATSALKAAIDRGAPFQAELETFAAIFPKAPQLAALRAHAEKGVATREDILAGTEAAAEAMIAAARPVDPNAGFFDRLLESAQSLISVRPVGAAAGGGAPETVARMEVALKAGDLGAALAEYDKLPDAAKAAGSAFVERIRARLEVERLADQAISGAMKA